MTPASANTPLTRADIQRLRNDVNLISDGGSARPARLSDEMEVGDSLSTQREAFAELRFNDGSLARIGELALFQFVPNTRTFELGNGTMLLLIPPGQGRSRLRTPNATAGIRGSALFVRHNAEADVTIIGALTNSGIEVANINETQQVELEAGHLAVFVGDRLERLYRFDLDRFYETSALVQDLSLESPELYADASAETLAFAGDESIAQVRAETLEALENHQFDETAATVRMPRFLGMTATPQDLVDAGVMDPSSRANPHLISPRIEQAGDRPIETLDRTTDAAEIQDNLTDRQQPERSPGSQGDRSQPGDRPGTSPGRDGNNPGNRPDTPPGRDGENPGNRPDTPPGQDGNNPGNRPDTPPGRDGENPGNRPYTPPGRDGENPGNRPDTPPGQDGVNPGNRPDVPPGQV
ncbi:MAG: FecR domain-containing protein [Leptolyngbyaceae bacterium]|nr:FecR domain-containing protein [Leptolyngbyaceae bacterium]